MSYGIPPPGYRLPQATHLGAVRLQVSNLDRSLDYYQQILGLQLIERGPTAAALAPIGDDRPLLHLQTDPGTRAAPRSSRLGLYHFAILVPDRNALGRFLIHLGARGVPVASADHDVSEALYLWDPDALGIEVYADRPRSLWKRQGAQLFMTSERLDVVSLQAAAGGLPWTGMPHGTTLGHMHLQVSDLERAEAFYHVALGFDKTVWDFPGALFLSAGGYHHHLGTNTWSPGAVRARPDEARLLEWEIVVPATEDQQEAVRSCQAAGYVATPQESHWVVSDPWGTTLRLRVD